MATEPQLAFIRRYSCLYTRDVVKKTKAWQDGYLVFHHLNAKMVLLSDKFTILDECFYRAPGLNTMRDIPKTYTIPSDTSISFDKHLSTLDEAVFEEEKDISELFQKTRKQVADLDDFVDSEDDEVVGVRLPKRSHNTASPAPARSALPPDARPGWLYRIGQSPAGSSAKAAASTPRSATSASSVPPTNTMRASLAGPQRTPLRLSVGKSASPIAVGSTSRTTTPFKPPSFVKSSKTGSPQPAAPSSVPRRTLGSTRPSSLLARQALQSEWSKYADQLPKITTKSTSYKNTSSRSFSSPAQTDEQRAANLEKFRKQAEPDIVPVNRNRRDGEEGDPSSWLFGDL